MHLQLEVADHADVPSTDGLRVLSFDGGGVRGKASLLLLRRIMDAIGPGAKPCDFFDLIGGTSTGALIAIMLAILEYTVDQAIAKYDEIGPIIFSHVAPQRVWLTLGDPRVNEVPAERVFQELGSNRFMVGGRCKCFVTTALQSRPETLIPIRSYVCNDGADPITSSGKKWRIWQAARAATAAPVYFKPFEIDGRQFIDAALGYNNPSVEIFHEVTTNIPGFTSRPIACFVSIGTGVGDHQPAPSISDRDETLTPIKLLGMKNRAEKLVHCLAAIAANTARVDREMRRTHMPNGPYFRFDPGRIIGSCEFSDISQLSMMEHLVWDHLRDNQAVSDQLRECAQTLKAASFLAAQALLLLHSRPPVIEPIQDDNWTRSSVLSSIPTHEGWLNIITLVEHVLMNPEAVPTFLIVFSVYRSLGRVLDILSDLFDRRVLDTLSDRFNHTPLNGGAETQVCILTLVSDFATNLWLRDEQIRKISNYFVSRAVPHPSVAHLQRSLRHSLEKAEQDNEFSDDEYSLEIKRAEFAAEIAQALAHLEDTLRRTDPVGECVRWLAKGCNRDFLSFPERVTTWVLQSILGAKPENMGPRYHLFYKVAKRSKDIYNFSAMHAIGVALQPLELLRSETKVETSQLKNMLALGVSPAMLKRKTLNYKKAYLHPLEIILKSKPSISESEVADHHQYIHWDYCQQLYSDVKGFTPAKDTPLTSSQEYNRNRAVGFTRRSLLNISLVEDKPIPDRVEAAIRIFRGARVDRPPLFRGQPQERRSVVITMPADGNG